MLNLKSIININFLILIKYSAILREAGGWLLSEDCSPEYLNYFWYLFKFQEGGEDKWSPQALRHGVNRYYNWLELLATNLNSRYALVSRAGSSNKGLISIFSFILTAWPLPSWRAISPNTVHIKLIFRSS